mmetsp:Transcript_32755/g.71526  ORF Transcript_32755/g.71526 Transcript_32755/m.71526 type:complete len:360 (-) Transcript_32755:87-1166(-)
MLVLGFPAYAVAICTSCLASLLNVVGFVLQATALRDPDDARRWHRFGDVVASPTWLAGFVLAVIAPVPGDLIAYSLAPLSLTAPLSGVTVVLNTIVAPAVLKEKLQMWPDLPATLLILLGVVCSTATGAREDDITNFDLSALLRLWLDVHFLSGLVVLCSMLLMVYCYSARHRVALEATAQSRISNPPLLQVLLPASLAAGTGAITNIWLKALGEMIKAGLPPLDYSLCILGLPFAWLQLNYVNRGMRLYPQTIFFPIYSALLVLCNTSFGALFYHEYNQLFEQRLRCIMFCCGVACVVLGISLYRLRKADYTAANLCGSSLTHLRGELLSPRFCLEDQRKQKWSSIPPPSVTSAPPAP